jgi:hypothetical protein
MGAASRRGVPVAPVATLALALAHRAFAGTQGDDGRERRRRDGTLAR